MAGPASEPVSTLAAETVAPPPADLAAMNIVIVGHVDHGKSTVVGRLLHDTGSLPDGRIEQVRRNCERSGKPFEYAFLIDALRDEQAQGITIDAARVFFRSARRRYIIIDAPGHVEFLKNMISGAARAEAAILVIDAREGVRENSRRHGFMTAMLGIRQILVVVNKMDLVGYDQSVFAAIHEEYAAFLAEIQATPLGFVPVSGRHGDNLVAPSPRTPWYDGPPLLERIDALDSAGPETEHALRLPVQDVYKFPVRGDDARIIAGTITTGRVAVGDTVEFLPSGKRSRVRSIEGFEIPPTREAAAGAATGVTLTEELYVRPGEVMYRVGEAMPRVGTTFRANLFWLDRNPLVRGRRYLLKLASTRVTVHVKEIVQVLDADTLERTNAKQHVGRHEVAECVLETHKPIAFDSGHRRRSGRHRPLRAGRPVRDRRRRHHHRVPVGSERVAARARPAPRLRLGGRRGQQAANGPTATASGRGWWCSPARCIRCWCGLRATWSASCFTAATTSTTSGSPISPAGWMPTSSASTSHPAVRRATRTSAILVRLPTS